MQDKSGKSTRKSDQNKEKKGFTNPQTFTNNKENK